MAYDLLAGIRVVELSMWAFAPSSTAVLADWGADVIKIVQPETGDPMRGTPIVGLPEKDVGVAFMWEHLNRGKRCIGLDVSTEAGHAVLLDLVKTADVFVTNLLPGARKRFKVDPEDLTAVNERLIYGRASGHGSRGPEREAGGFDHTDFWARTGIAHAAGLVAGEFVPQVGPALGDVTAGASMAGALAAALFRRERTGQGAVVEVSLLSAGVWTFAPSIIASKLYGIDTIPRSHHADLKNPLVAAYTTRDGRQLYIALLQTEKNFAELCDVLGHPELVDDPRFRTGADRAANARECIAVLDVIFAERDLDEWLKRFPALTSPWTVVQNAAEAAADPQVTANGYVVDVDNGERVYPLVASPAQFDDELPTLRPAPGHGEHTDEILLELGRNWDELIQLKTSATIL